MWSMMASPSLATRKSAGRTVVLLIPGVKVPAGDSLGAANPFSAAASVLPLTKFGSNNGADFASGILSPNVLDQNCLEGLLGYVRLLFAQPGGGKLLLLGGLAPGLHGITSWDPGQQTLDSVMKGLSLWRPSIQEFSPSHLQLAVQEALQLLFKPTNIHGEDAKSRSKLHASDLWKEGSMARLIVIMTNNWGADGSAEVYHRMIVAILSKIEMRASDGECCDAVFLDLSSSEGQSSSSVCMQDANIAIPLSTVLYKLSPMCASDLLLDLAYFHLELSAVDVKGLTTSSLKTLENPGSSALRQSAAEDKSRMAFNVSGDVGLRFVLCQASPAPLPGDCFNPSGGELRKTRTTVLFRLKTPFSKSQLLALPCMSVTPALLEAPFSMPLVKLWDAVRVTDVDAEGYVVLALGSDRDSTTVTHLLVWHLERFWVRTLATRDGPVVKKWETRSSAGDLPDEKESLRSQMAPIFPSDDLIASSGSVTGDKILYSKKQGHEDGDEAGNHCGPLPGVSENKISKHLERSARHHPMNMTYPETVDGGLDRHSATLTALMHPVRVVFTSEDPSSELVNTATSYIARLLELTEKNDGSLFPHVDVPVVRKELYKKMWWDLKRLAKRSRKEKTQGQEDLVQAIRAVKADFNSSETQPPMLSQPMPALTDKPSENVHINKRRRCEEVPRDVHGHPILPIKLGPSLQVFDLGTIVWNRPAFHSEKYIWPAGYKSRRAYASMLNSENRIFYWCEIVDDGQAPEFRLTPEDDENNPVIGISATAVWTVVVKRVGALRLEEGGKKTFANVSGPEYFGFANPTIARLIQQLPNSEMCTKYKRQDYFPNVPMRATELDALQANESTSSSPRRDVVTDDKADSQVHSPHEQADDPELTIADDRSDDVGVVPASVDAEEEAEKRSWDGVQSELRGMSWDSEEFRKARARTGKLGLGEYSKQFLASNSGSLFSYYWSAKLERVEGEPELDGRK